MAELTNSYHPRAQPLFMKLGYHHPTNPSKQHWANTLRQDLCLDLLFDFLPGNSFLPMRTLSLAAAVWDG